VKGVYLIEANILGFAGEQSGLDEQSVLGNAIKWALSDYANRYGGPPNQIVLHLDVNGTLALGDVASKKGIGVSANGLARDVLTRLEATSSFSLPAKVAEAMERVKTATDDVVREEYTINYSGNDFIRAMIVVLGALAPAAIRELDEELAGSFTETMTSEGTRKAFALAAQKDSLERPAVTIAIRTNGVEHRQAAAYVQRLVMGVLGLEISEERDTLRRYVVTHEDQSRGLYFHPVLLEKLHKSNGGITFADYFAELGALGRADSRDLDARVAALKAVSSGTLKKSDPQFKQYLGLASSADEKPAEHSSAPPKLQIAFARETWLMPQVSPNAKHKDFKLASAVPSSPGPWWAGFAHAELAPSPAANRSRARRFSHQPYGISIASEPVPTKLAWGAEPPTLGEEGSDMGRSAEQDKSPTSTASTASAESSSMLKSSSAVSCGGRGDLPGSTRLKDSPVQVRPPASHSVAHALGLGQMGARLAAAGGQLSTQVSTQFEDARRRLMRSRGSSSPAAARGVVL